MLRADRGGEVPGSSSNAASPGFTYGRSGNLSSGTYLLNDTVPGNKSGRVVMLYDAVITEAFIAVENNTTCVLSILRRTTGSYAEIGTISLTAERKKVITLNIPVDREDEIAIQVKSGSCKNPDVGLVLKGDSA